MCDENCCIDTEGQEILAENLRKLLENRNVDCAEDLTLKDVIELGELYRFQLEDYSLGAIKDTCELINEVGIDYDIW